jgi:hypothetical protein
MFTFSGMAKIDMPAVFCREDCCIRKTAAVFSARMTSLAQYLADKNESVRDFAQRAGCDKSAVSRAKNGKEITLTNAQRIVKATRGEVTFDDLLPRRSGKRH